MNLAELRTLLAILECGSMAGAGRAIGYSTGAISRQISRLERRYGVQLFEPSGRTIRPTEAAIELGDQIRELMAILDRMERGLKRGSAPAEERPALAGIDSRGGRIHG